jgi:hypothetical protein
MAVTFDFAHRKAARRSLSQTFAAECRSLYQAERNFRYEIPGFHA